MAGEAAVLAIEGLCKRYPNGVRALEDVSLTIRPGVFGLLGPNGAGKSTLMRILATLQVADRGSARLGDIDVLRDKEELRKHLGYLPQEFGLYPEATAFDLLDHLARLKGYADARQRRETVSWLLERTNLFEARGRRLGTFSGGMKQRFGIAQALLGAPRLVIVDEPTAGLDPEERHRFHNLLSDMGEHLIVVLSTHIVGDVSDLCGQIAILSRGRVLASGEPEALTAELSGRLWQKRVSAREAAEYEERTFVVSRRRLAGQAIVRVYGEEPPHDDASGPASRGGFEPATPDLEDYYLYRMRIAAGSLPAEPAASGARARVEPAA